MIQFKINKTAFTLNQIQNDGTIFCEMKDTDNSRQSSFPINTDEMAELIEYFRNKKSLGKPII